MPHLRYDMASNIATITLTNPSQNRIGVQMVTELEAAIDAMAHGDARVLLVRAEGPDFSFGGDISTWPGAASHDLHAVFDGYLSIYRGNGVLCTFQCERHDYQDWSIAMTDTTPSVLGARLEQVVFVKAFDVQSAKKRKHALLPR